MQLKKLALALAALGCAASTGAAELSPQDWFDLGAEAVQEAKRLNPSERKAKNVILFVGDGMGVSTVTAARILEGQMQGRDGEGNRLAFERFPHLALSVTASANQQTSDSAPTATAMVTGVKTNDGAISMNQFIDRNEKSADITAALSLRTIMEEAEIAGLSTGVVSTARITHATPAVNYAHVGNRDWESDNNLPAGATVKDIAAQLIDFPYGNGIEVALGGGRSRFYPNTEADPEYPSRKGARLDGRRLYAEWTAKGKNSTYIWNKAQFDAIDPTKTDRLLGLFERSHMHYEADRADDVGGEPSLAEMTAKAIDILSKNKKGYYLMVEAGRIDHAHHGANAYRALTDTVALSEAVKVALEKTGNAEDTLIVVTADHSHVFTIAGYPKRGNPILGKVVTANETAFSKDMFGLPYTTVSYANGPGYTGTSYTDSSKSTVLQPAGAKTFTNPAGSEAGSEGHAPRAYDPAPGRPDLNGVNTEDPSYLQEATVPLSSETHAGEDVAIYAAGPKAHLFHGTQEQNVIYHVMKEALQPDHPGRGHHDARR